VKKCEKNTAAAHRIALKRNIRLFGETIPLGEIKSVSLTRYEARRIAVISRNCLTCGLLSAVPDAQRRLEYQKASADFTQSCHKSNRRF
jgi:hypothetical protein